MSETKCTPLSDANVIPVAVVLIMFDQQGSFDWADRYIRTSYQAEHCGDCIKVPCTCNRCVADEYMEKARALVSEMEKSELGGSLSFVPDE